MSTRITDSMLNKRIERLNKITGSPAEPFDSEGKPQPGHFSLDLAYGGVNVERFDKDGGSTRPIDMGFTTKRHCFDMIGAYMAGVREGKAKEQEDLELLREVLGFLDVGDVRHLWAEKGETSALVDVLNRARKRARDAG